MRANFQRCGSVTEGTGRTIRRRRIFDHTGEFPINGVQTARQLTDSVNQPDFLMVAERRVPQDESIIRWAFAINAPGHLTHTRTRSMTD
jgi:hypothetical protein